MSLKMTLAVAAVMVASSWFADAAAQTPQQNQANRARPATQGAVDDLRDELAKTNRELATLTRLMEAAMQHLQETRDGIAELRLRASEARDRLAESGSRIAETRDRVAAIVERLAEIREDSRTALVSVAVSPGAGSPSQAFRESAAQTCEAMAGSQMSSEVFYAQSGASIGTSQVVCRLRPR